MFLIVFKSVCHKIFASQKEKLYTFKQLKHTQYLNACSIEYKVYLRRPHADVLQYFIRRNNSSIHPQGKLT
jgi:hypothetical protein